MYREEEKLCLKWNDFQENAISAFGTLREDREFADVTLACEDGLQVEAHKVVLASSSPFFLDLLRRNKHTHPLIYMRGLKSVDLVAMVDFFYFGEANVYQENLDSFLAVAEELQLKGLMGSVTEEEVERINNKTTVENKPPKPKRNPSQKVVKASDTDNFEAKVDTSPLLEGTVAVNDFTVAADLQDLDDKIKSMMMFSGNRTADKQKMRLCNVCGKEGVYANMRHHIEAHHITGVSHSCNICGITTRSRHSMIMHKRRKHKSL